MNGLRKQSKESLPQPQSEIIQADICTNYHVHEEIGRGKFAVVRRCTHKVSGADVAAKFIRKKRRGKNWRDDILKEVVMLELAVSHPHLVDLLEVYETANDLILVTEYCSGGELFHECVIEESFSEADVIRFTRQIVEGLVFLHERCILHLDLKPQNVLLTKPFPHGDIKLCDFGFSCLIRSGDDIREILGTPDYVAPEVLNYEKLSLATDMWSLGVMTYVMLTACSPFVGDTQQETYCNITIGDIQFPDSLFENKSPLCRDFIERLVQKSPKNRMTALECLQHPWLARNETRCDCETMATDAEDVNDSLGEEEVPSKKHKCNSPGDKITDLARSGPSCNNVAVSVSEPSDTCARNTDHELMNISETSNEEVHVTITNDVARDNARVVRNVSYCSASSSCDVCKPTDLLNNTQDETRGTSAQSSISSPRVFSRPVSNTVFSHSALVHLSSISQSSASVTTTCLTERSHLSQTDNATDMSDDSPVVQEVGFSIKPPPLKIVFHPSVLNRKIHEESVSPHQSGVKLLDNECASSEGFIGMKNNVSGAPQGEFCLHSHCIEKNDRCHCKAVDLEIRPLNSSTISHTDRSQFIKSKCSCCHDNEQEGANNPLNNCGDYLPHKLLNKYTTSLDSTQLHHSGSSKCSSNSSSCNCKRRNVIKDGGPCDCCHDNYAPDSQCHFTIESSKICDLYTATVETTAAVSVHSSPQLPKPKLLLSQVLSPKSDLSDKPGVETTECESFKECLEYTPRHNTYTVKVKPTQRIVVPSVHAQRAAAFNHTPQRSSSRQGRLVHITAPSHGRPSSSTRLNKENIPLTSLLEETEVDDDWTDVGTKPTVAGVVDTMPVAVSTDCG